MCASSPPRTSGAVQQVELLRGAEHCCRSVVDSADSVEDLDAVLETEHHPLVHHDNSHEDFGSGCFAHLLHPDLEIGSDLESVASWI